MPRGPALVALALLAQGSPALADPARDAIIAALGDQARQADAAFAGFSAERGAAFYGARHATKDPNVSACASCHGADPTAAGQNVQTGKAIEPMAVSANPKRFTSPDETEKWFRRNCKDVLGRACTPVEKGDFITFLMGK